MEDEVRFAGLADLQCLLFRTENWIGALFG